MNKDIFELSEEEISAISGGTQIDPPAALAAATVNDEFPQIDNDPPG